MIFGETKQATMSIEILETKKINLFKESIIYGVIIAVGLIGSSLVSNAISDTPNSTLASLLMWCILGGGLAYAIIQIRNNKNDGLLSFGQGFKISLFAGIIAGLINAVYTYIYMKFISPEMIDKLKEVAINDMVSSGNTEDEIKIGLQMMDVFMQPGVMALMIVFMIPIYCMIIGLILAAIFKKEK
ncbi:MAG: hypothetical protein RLZZ77_1705 [Bacteroidota bacterium]